MNRKHLFRGKQIDNGKLVIGGIYHSDDDRTFIVMDILEHIKREDYVVQMAEVYPESIERLWFSDKNMKIFVGDKVIITFHDGVCYDNLGFEPGGWLYGKVQEDEDNDGSFVLLAEKGQGFTDWHDGWECFRLGDISHVNGCQVELLKLGEAEHDIDCSPNVDDPNYDDPVILSFEWDCPICKHHYDEYGLEDSMLAIDMQALGNGDILECPECQARLLVTGLDGWKCKVKELIK